MKRIILYNSITGEILARVTMSRDEDIKKYYNYVELTKEDYEKNPAAEETHKINVITKKMEKKT